MLLISKGCRHRFAVVAGRLVSLLLVGEIGSTTTNPDLHVSPAAYFSSAFVSNIHPKRGFYLTLSLQVSVWLSHNHCFQVSLSRSTQLTTAHLLI